MYLNSKKFYTPYFLLYITQDVLQQFEIDTMPQNRVPHDKGQGQNIGQKVMTPEILQTCQIVTILHSTHYSEQNDTKFNKIGLSVVEI